MSKPLSDLEMFELLVAAYPEKFGGEETDDLFEEVMEFAHCLEGWSDISDLLGRVVMTSLPMASPLTGTAYHTLGKVTVLDGTAMMEAAVKREVIK